MFVGNKGLCILLCFAIGLLVYSFIEKGSVQRQIKVVQQSLITTSLNLDHAIALYERQSGERRKRFNRAFGQENPKVSTVLLAIVPEVHCPAIARVGSVGDGGKWVCNPWAMPRGGVVYSLGSHNDVSFEKDFQKTTDGAASIFTVDMNPASKGALAALEKINGQYTQAKITDVTNTTIREYTVEDLMKLNGHDRIELLKMDIEGAELNVLPQFLESNSVCQIMVEIHSIGKVPKLLRSIANAGFYLLHYELNAFFTGVGLCEYSFIHEDCLDKYGATLLASYIRDPDV